MNEININNAITKIKKANFVYIIGNGGSASTANHFANDLVKMCGLKAVSLCANASIITALGNDNGYENIFKDQLKVFLQKEDLLITISCSGTSKNIVKAINYAKGVKANIYSFPTMNQYGCSIQKAEDKHLELAHEITTELCKR